MYLISAERYKNAGVDLLIIKKLVKFGQNIFGLVLKEIYGIYKTKRLTKEQIKRY